MKTLDEVIKALELCTSNKHCQDECPYAPEECPTYAMEKDALHYLKEYQAILPLVPSLITTAIAVQKKGKTIG